MMSRFLDRGQTKDGHTIQMRIPLGAPGWIVTVDQADGNIIVVRCVGQREAEECARWMEQFTTAELPDKLSQRPV